MDSLLARATLVVAVAVAGAPAVLHAAESDRHQWHVELAASYAATDSALASWPGGGLGKLRYAESDDDVNAVRLFAHYRGRITPTLWTTAVLDYVGDASSGLDVSEVFLDWRPIPTSPNQHQLRVGMFYPPLSLENGESGWQSPFTYSYSAINTWIGEEIRPIGVEWSLRRRLGGPGSPHELRAFAAGFFGNDPAATLLFWRGWSLHDRQTRLNDRFRIPPLPVFGAGGAQVGTRTQILEPFEEIDHEPGVYAGLEWWYARRLLLQLARYDNRADPEAFAAGEWAWHTSFTHFGAQLSLPGEIGLVTQWMKGDTLWLSGAWPDGNRAPTAQVVGDVFKSKFALLTRVLRGVHRVSLRYDDFEIVRDEPSPALVADSGHAWTLAYRYERSARLGIGFEWLQITSRRDLWPAFYSLPREATERQLRVQISLKQGAPR